MMYKTIANYYRMGLFTQSDIDNFVSIGWITDQQRIEILLQEA